VVKTTDAGSTRGNSLALSLSLSLSMCVCMCVCMCLCVLNNWNSKNVSLVLYFSILTQPPVRQEASQGLYRLCLGHSEDGVTGHSYLLPVLAHLLHSLDDALSLKPPRKQVCYNTKSVFCWKSLM